ncbi:probable disease resistance protein At5g63020 [Vitis riparia]|uniref:probable disease resistance protein At5g63020 n=1 Tax=Vitis riparia TaxID=96939 RepID=UPI00155ABF8E|nr:probable disease resistance protein At5g63020 [Vitis riparia]
MTTRREVEGWLQDVGKEDSEVAAILQEGDGALEKVCLGRYCNIRSSYKLGKRVSGKITRVRDLTSRGDFETVAYRLLRDVVDELPLGRTVGLDSLYEKKPLDLSDIGVPLPDARNKSKPLACEEAWTLFSELVGEDTLNSSPGIQQLAHSTLERCQGLPSAIIMAGRTLAGCKIVREWEQLTQELEDLIKEEISGEDRLPHAVVDEMPLGHTVGLDSLYETVCSCLTGYQAGIIALYGTGGVGKQH